VRQIQAEEVKRVTLQERGSNRQTCREKMREMKMREEESE
jgi:hypothetical protein